MGDSKKKVEEEVKADYASSLADLTFNSKPLINMLTMLAEENIAHAAVIVEAIETHLARVRTDVKLPILYLIDCIVKNVGGTYTTLFSQNIVLTFCSVFKVVEEKTRAEMFKLRQTWNEIFPPKKLYALDVQIHMVDPAWPVTAPPPNSIHLNPKFLKTNTSTTNKMSDLKKNVPVANQAATIDPKSLSMQQELIRKQKELLELQQKKLELELLQNQMKLQEQQLQTGVKGGQPQNILLKPEVAKQLLPPHVLPLTSSGNSSSGSNSTNTVTRSRGFNATVQNKNQVGRINPVSSSLVSASVKRPIRDPRLLRQQQQQEQQQKQQQTQSNTTNVQLEPKGTLLESNNKVIVSKTSVRDTTERSCDSRSNKESFLSSKNKTESHKVKPTRPVLPAPSSPPQSRRVLPPSPSKVVKSPRAKLQQQLFDHRPKRTSPSVPGNSVGSQAKKSRSDSGRSPSKHHGSKKRDGGPVVVVRVKKCLSKDGDGAAGAGAGSTGTGGGASSGISTSSSKSDSMTMSSINSGSGSGSGTGSFKQNKSETTTVFKGVKGSKGRNYMRHNRATSDSPEPPRDVDLRMSVPDGLPPRNESALKKSGNVEVAAAVTKDTDLRQIVGKKRLSTEDTELPTKKSKTELLDELFGNEDTDLRQLPPINDRPPTPPPPIISTVAQKEAEKKSESPQKPNLEALRAKLAIATLKDKKLSPSQQDKTMKEDEDLRPASTPGPLPSLAPPPSLAPLPSAPAPANEINNKIIISPADEKCIKEGKMSNEQGHQLMNKIIAQIETQKLREAQKKDNEFANTSLQPISDDELDMSMEEEPQSNRSARDKDERHMGAPPTNNGSGFENQPIDFGMMYPNRMPFEEPHFKFNRRGMPPNWRGGRRRPWDIPPLMRPGLRPRMHPPGNWRAMGPGFESNDTGRSQSPAPAPIHAPDHETLIVESVNQDEMKTICIDSIPREIRYYDDVAIVFMNWDDPREISFQNGVRTVFFNDKETLTLSFDDSSYHDVMINGSLHQVKFGAPSREILIDGKPYECFFGGPGIVISLDNVPVSVRLEGPAPQVKIGSVRRTDLVAGKISLVIDAKRIYPVYLDGKTQMFILDGVTHTIKFVDGLKAVVINDIKINVEFGGLPKPIVFQGKKYFIRFTVLPKGIKPGHVYIKDMEGCGPAPPGPAVGDESSQDGFPAGVNTSDPALPIPAKRRFNLDNVEEQDSNSNPPNILQSILHNQNLSSSLDVLSSVLSSPVISNPNSAGYQVENTVNRMNKPENVIAPSPSGLNINELFQKLVASGMVTTGKQRPPVEPVPAPKPDSDPTKTATKKSLADTMKPVLFSKPETLKTRQNVLYDMLYSGMQCSSCGMRFPPELSLQYSQHLDWHFRQNRKGKKNIRVASSRRWYYSLSDWKSYEEIEDLEEREKSYFDQLQTEGASDETEEVEELVSVQADPEIQYSRCDVCMDIFDQFFNEEKEEWHLKNAIRVENRTYHPTCYDDYKASLAEPQPEQPVAEPVTVIDETSIPGLEIVNLDDEEEDEIAEKSQEDKMSVIIEEEQTKMSEGDKEPGETSPDDGRKEEDYRDDEEDDDVIINEVIPEKIVVDDDDDDEEMVTEPEQPKPVVRNRSLDDNFMDIEDALLAFQSGPVKVKTEPKDPGEEEIFDLSTEDGVNPRTAEVLDTTSDKQDLDELASKNPPLPVRTVLKSSIDGNVELDSGAVTAPHAGLGAKIKINISKAMPAAPAAKEKPKEVQTAVDSCVAQPKIFLDPSQPLPPGEEPVLLNLKPALQGVELKQFPPVRRGSELTGMCSIM